MQLKRLKRKKNENFFKVIFIQIILVLLGYLAGGKIYSILKGVLNFELYGIFNLFFDLVFISIAVFLGWWLWDYSRIFKKKERK
jgi:magnesium-transporting ATPase (P-type)